MDLVTTDIHSRTISIGGRKPTPRRGFALVGLILAAGTLTGCSGRGTYITGGPSSGQLKASVSHLEFENDQLKTQVARLKEENRAFEDRLVQEQLHNGEITAKLDNVRNVLRDQGYSGDADVDLDAPLGRARTLPAGRTTPPKRRAPAAQISKASDSEEIPPIRIDDNHRDTRSSTSSGRSRSSKATTDPDDAVGMREDDLRWTPIARGGDAPATPKR
ncbi:hypothetical protein [Paludisphaera mucosa]|uniref:Uncharacterized protein n=1 Tax=Paludisphaera mucosa TaxID=3030827 RepID=A0ABT6F8C5_9BACT|nr:hypothetical protein [Paludisphaera mucosa]MDG3003643.1 hypothetical protein [Paludisphaera mucosa]